MGLKSSEHRWNKFSFCSSGFIKVWFMDHVHQHQLDVCGEMQISGPHTKENESELLRVELKKKNLHFEQALQMILVQV